MFRRIQIVKTGEQAFRHITSKQKLKDYAFPEIKTKDCDMQVINGWGPGGSRVNAIKNAVFLRHKETGLHVKVHESRLLPDNIDIAFERLKHVLDRHLNGDACYDEQLKELERIREDRNKSKRLKSRLLKANLGSEIPIIEKN